MAPCVTPASSSPFMGFAGNVQSVLTMICAQFATTVISIILGIVSIESPLLVPRGILFCVLIMMFSDSLHHTDV